MRALRLCVAAVFFSASAALAADWPQWRGTNRDGISKDTGLLKSWPKDGPKLLWTFDKAGIGYGSPAIVGDKLFLLGADDPDKGEKEFALCINAKTSAEIWRHPLANSPGGYSNGWGAGPRSSPTVDGDRIYVLGARGDLECLKMSDGSKVWGLNLVKDLGGNIPAWGYAESVLIDGDHLLCTPGGKKGTIACLKKKTGEVVWRSTGVTDEAQYSSIVISSAGAKQYVTLNKSGTISVRASDGDFLWRSKAGANGTAVAPTAIIDDKYVFSTSGYGSGCGLLELSAGPDDGVKMKEVYLNKAMVNLHGGVIRVGQFIYGYSDSGNWLCLDYLKLDNDTQTPTWKSNKLDKGSLTYADGHFYLYGQNKGTCALIEANPKAWVEKGRFEISKKSQFPRRSGEIWTHPVVANGRLYLRDHEVLASYEIKAD